LLTPHTGHKHKKVAILRLGAAPLLVQLLDGSASCSTSEAAVHAADALSSLCQGCPDGAAAVWGAGGVAVLARRFAECAGDEALSHACLRALACLAPRGHLGYSRSSDLETSAFASLADVAGVVSRLVAVLETVCPLQVGNAAARVLAECIIVAPSLAQEHYSCAINALVGAIEARECGVSAAPLVIALHGTSLHQTWRTGAPPPYLDAVVACVTKFSVIATDVRLRGGRDFHERTTLTDAAFCVADLLLAVDRDDSAHAAQCLHHAVRLLVAEFLHPETTELRCEHIACLLTQTRNHHDGHLPRLFHGEALLAGLVNRVVLYLGREPHAPVGQAQDVLWLLEDALGAPPWSRVRSVSSDELVLALARFVSLNYERCSSHLDWCALAHAAALIAPAYIRLTDRKQPSVYTHTLFGFLLGVAPALSATGGTCDGDLCHAACECLGGLAPLFEDPALELLPAEVEFLRRCCDATATAHPEWENKLLRDTSGSACEAASLLLVHHGRANPSSAAVSLAPVLLWVLTQTQTGQQSIRDECAWHLACLVQVITAGGAPQLARLEGCCSAADFCSSALRIATGCVAATLSDLQGLSAVGVELMPDTCVGAWLDRPSMCALHCRLRCCDVWLGTLVNAAAGNAEWADCLLPNVVEGLVTSVLDQFYPAALAYTAMQKAALPDGATGPLHKLARGTHVDKQLADLYTSIDGCCAAATFLVYNLAKTRAGGSRKHVAALRRPAMLDSLRAWQDPDLDLDTCPEGHWQRAIPEGHPARYRASAALYRLRSLGIDET
jgi:hypothetical protein